MNVRNLLLFLLLANVLFFWWASIVVDRQEEIATDTGFDSNIPQLELVAERDAQLGVAAQQSRCFTVGPFLEETLAEQWQSSLLRINIPSRIRLLVESEPKSYWIYLDPAPSLVAARLIVTQLAEKGVEEYYIVREAGPTQYAISLGLYNGIGKARERLNELKAKKVTAKMDTRYRDVNHYWLDVQDDREGSGDRLVVDMMEKEAQIRQLDAECAELDNLID